MRAGKVAEEISATYHIQRSFELGNYIQPETFPPPSQPPQFLSGSAPPRPVEAPVLSFNKAAFVPDKASRQRSSVRRKIPACRSTERCPEGILSLRRQSQIPTEIDGLLASLCGEPFSRERWLLSFPTNTYDSQLGSETNTQMQGGRARAIDGQMPATHTEKCWALSAHALSDRLAGRTAKTADRVLTYAHNTHKDTSVRCTRRLRRPPPHNKFLPCFSWMRRMGGFTPGSNLDRVIQRSAPFSD